MPPSIFLKAVSGKIKIDGINITLFIYQDAKMLTLLFKISASFTQQI